MSNDILTSPAPTKTQACRDRSRHLHRWVSSWGWARFGRERDRDETNWKRTKGGATGVKGGGGGFGRERSASKVEGGARRDLGENKGMGKVEGGSYVLVLVWTFTTFQKGGFWEVRQHSVRV